VLVDTTYDEDEAVGVKADSVAENAVATAAKASEENVEALLDVKIVDETNGSDWTDAEKDADKAVPIEAENEDERLQIALLNVGDWTDAAGKSEEFLVLGGAPTGKYLVVSSSVLSSVYSSLLVSPIPNQS
jgi:hypothetical protein